MICIKKCPNPYCDAIYHNIPKKVTKCNDCGGNIIQINLSTWKQKYQDWYFQYDYLTMDYYHPKQLYQLTLFNY